MRFLFAGLAASILIIGCGDSQRMEGGFETPDIQALVLTPQGTPAVGARVWLVRSRGDTAPAQVVDSAFSDSNGIARFPGRPANQVVYGIDARSEALMAMAPGSLVRTDSVALHLADTCNLAVSTDSAGARPQLYVPGSHFESHRSTDGTREVLPVPRGTWNVAVKTSGKVVVWNDLKVESSLVFLPRDSLPQGPRMDLDSFVVDGMRMYTKTLALPSTWSSLTGSQEGFVYVPGTVSDDTGRTAFHIGGDSGGSHQASGIQRILPYAQGTVGLTFEGRDSILWFQTRRTLSLLDSGGTGVVLDIDTLSDGSINSLLKVSDSGMLSLPADTAMIQPSDWNTTRVLTWYFTWSGSRIVLRNSAGWSASVERTFKTVPTLRIGMRTTSSTVIVVHLLQARLFSPP